MQPKQPCCEQALDPTIERPLIYKNWLRYSFQIGADRASRAQLWALAARRSRYKAQKLAEHSQMHIRQVERRCNEELGRAPQEWLNEQKLVAARWLLLENESIKEVAAELGFKQLSHFCRQFKHAYGVTPSQYILLHKRFSAVCR